MDETAQQPEHKSLLRQTEKELKKFECVSQRNEKREEKRTW